MPNTPRTQWPYPTEQSDPWFDTFESLILSQDATAYANREDRSLIMSAGGVFSWNSGTNTLSWSSDIEILSPVSGFKVIVPTGNVSILNGQNFYVNVARAPTASVSVSTSVSSQVPNTNDAYVIAVRNGTDLYFRNGQRLMNGESRSLFSTGGVGGVSGEKYINIVWGAGREHHNSTTPMIVGAFQFNPADYVISGTTMAISFRAIAANGNTGLTNHVRLVNLTDSDNIATLDFTSMAISVDEASLVIGSGAGQIDNSAKVYEVQIYLGASPVSEDDAIELYSAELRLINTVV